MPRSENTSDDLIDYSSPSDALIPYQLSREVISCAEASIAKGIPLENELKTLIISTGKRYYALHLAGNKLASLRKVKRFLKVDQAFMLPPDQLQAIGLIPGTVSPVVEPVWSLPHLISKSVLDLSFVSTNNGTRSQYFKFSPHILLAAREILVGDFDK